MQCFGGVFSMKYQLFHKKLIYIAYLKALNKRISEWVCFLNLNKGFQSYSNFCRYLKKLKFFGILNGDYQGDLKTGMAPKTFFSCFIVTPHPNWKTNMWTWSRIWDTIVDIEKSEKNCFANNYLHFYFCAFKIS